MVIHRGYKAYIFWIASQDFVARNDSFGVKMGWIVVRRGNVKNFLVQKQISIFPCSN
ncbi:MAG: hypothetical protein J6K16_07725 [Alphaproteobacteria bacterium]|nr:hypothetical protein [Alphaproteobacteria bacterium]